MKTAIYLFSTLFIILAGVIIMRKSFDQHPISTDITLMRDITDAQISQPKLTDVSSLLNLDNSKWDGAYFKFVDLTDVSYNHNYEAKIDPENQWLGNELDRDKKVKQFYSEINQILMNADSEKVGKVNSSIYKPIASELNRLSQRTSQNRYLLVYSDLEENTDKFSFYDNKNIKLLRMDPDSIKNYFEALAPLKNLTGIKVYLIYQPKNNQADELYQMIAGLYKTLLVSKGATVEITANIN
jgi:hypothetical protein